MWIKFNRDYSYVPPDQRNVTINYKAGGSYSVTRTCADQVTKAGAGAETQNPRHEEALKDVDSSTSDDGNSKLQAQASEAAPSVGQTGGFGFGEKRARDAGGGTTRR